MHRRLRLILPDPATQEPRVQENADWEEFLRALESLDGGVRSDLVLEANDQLSIGGGAGRYFVSKFTATEESFVLVDPSRAHLPRELLISGGQKVSLPASRVVSLEHARAAGRSLFEGADDSTLTWEQE